jgi:chemotaxis protein methyltransferase CheR
MPLPLTTPVFAILRAHIEEKTGISHSESERDMFLAKISPRAEEAGFASLLDYYYFLKYDPAGEAELDALIEHLVVRETYLFREFEQLRSVVQHFVAPQVAAGQRVRIWSAACATGEEPLSLALLLAEAGLLDQVDIVATDISQQALDTARRGRYTRRSLRAFRPSSPGQRWVETENDAVVISRRLVDRIDWRRLNLVDGTAISSFAPFDIVLCRNVLIYFSDQTTRAVIDSITGVLRPGGVLLVSVTESIMRLGTTLTCEERDAVFFYRKATAP